MTLGAEDMEELDAKLDAIFGECENSGGVTPSAVDAAQEELGLVFPPSYRRYLERFGASLGTGFSIFGVHDLPFDGDFPPMWEHVVRSTKALHPNSLPDKSILVSHDGMSTAYFIRCSKTDLSYEGHIIEWGPDFGEGRDTNETFLDLAARLAGP